MKFLEQNIFKIASISKNYSFVCLITNQPQISMGFLTEENFDAINNIVIKYCLTKGLKIDVVTFCPHHPHRGFSGEVEILKEIVFVENQIRVFF